ncbi:hypothetical protein N0V90_007079 [Kalmusia sp. IMI 367209]|nr:hypothetical protein N0V90_007079 [Kalmusia sp. IMI 367209]
MSFDLSNPNRTIQAGVILMGETEILDVAPIDFLHGLNKKFAAVLPISDELKAKALDIEFHWVTEKGEPAKLTAGISLNATDSYESCPPLDIVLIGAYFPDYTPNEADLAFIRKAYNDCICPPPNYLLKPNAPPGVAFLTICGGMIPAQIAGVLAEHTCTAPRFMVSLLQQQDPRTKWVEKRAVRDGKIWTSGALLNGLDLMQEFAKTYWPELAEVAIPLGGWPERSLEYEGEEKGIQKGFTWGTVQ